jgi:hypothetical protein
MKDLTVKTMVICAAISLYLGSAFTVIKGLDTLANEKIRTTMVVQQTGQAAKAAEDTVERSQGQ